MSHFHVRLIRYLASAILLSTMSAAAHAGLDLKTIMQDPDWIGAPVEAAWWLQDGSGYVYQSKRLGTTVRDWYVVAPGGKPQLLEDADYPAVDGRIQVISPDRRHLMSLRDGELWLRTMTPREGQEPAARTGGSSLTLLSGLAPIKSAHFSADGKAALFYSQGRWWRQPLDGGGAYSLTDLRFENDPLATPDDALEQAQLRLFSTLAKTAKEAREEQSQRLARSRAVPETGAAPWYLGDGHSARRQYLSADGRWLLLILDPAGDTSGPVDQMPRYVTVSGYVDVEEVRSLVGRDGQQAQSLLLLDLIERREYPIDLASLPGRDTDPLHTLKQAQGIEPHDDANLRPLGIADVIWHPEHATALVQIMSLDHKDRWIVTLDALNQHLQPIHRLTDNAWINWDFNDMGWVPGSDRIWFLSEESGYAHVYTSTLEGSPRAITTGAFELRSPRWQPDGSVLYVVSNRSHPTEWDLYAIDPSSGAMRRLTEQRGIESFELDYAGGRALVRYSGSYLPSQVGVLDLNAGTWSDQTDTRTATYRAFSWQEPQFFAVPSAEHDRPIWSKFYPADSRFTGPRPAVLFVHGAGYTQNTHHKFPYYFREQMFHNLLTSKGYHVLDMDYRGSEGYGRDWRTAIYRQMGTPELADYIDGVRWLIREHQVDPERVGIYGGSYGGFMTFMALFKAPDVFTAGAALRPVTDWTHYNHGYTSAILNTPQVDPEAYQRSSPIELVEGFQGHLLISHGMLDDNVFYKDSVRIAQRLIELEKTDWELASYPLEPHGYIHPESWLDQYRRILKLFQRTIGDDARTLTEND